MISSSNYSADIYVTASNPSPGRDLEYAYQVHSGTGIDIRYASRSDGGIGVNVYIAGGLGPGGSIPVSQTNPSSISLSGVTIEGILEVTTSAGNPVGISGSVYVLNPTTEISGVVSISGTASVNIQNFPATQSVEVSNLPATQSVAVISSIPLQVSGNVGVVGTASVRIEGSAAPLEVFGTASITGTVVVENTGVFVQNLPATQSVSIENWPAPPVPITGVEVLNLPATQSVFVVNQTSGSVIIDGTASVSVSNFPPPITEITATITGVIAVSQTNVPVTQTVFVANQTSGSVSIDGTASVSVSNFPTTQAVSGTGVFFVQEMVPITGVFVLGTASVSISNLQSITPSTGVEVLNTITASITGVVATSQTNLPATQSVYVVNQDTALSGVNVVSGALQITGTVQVGGISISGTTEQQPNTCNHFAFPYDDIVAITLLPAAATRRTFTIYNDSNQTYLVRLGPGASTNVWSFSLFPQEYYENPFPSYTGIVTAIGYTAGSGTIHVEEQF